MDATEGDEDRQFRLVLEGAQVTERPYYSGGVGAGVRRYLRFENTGGPTKLEVTVELYSPLPDALFPLEPLEEPPGTRLTKSFDIQGQTTYSLMIDFGGVGPAPPGTYVISDGVGLRIYSEPAGIGYQTTVFKSLYYEGIRIANIAVEPWEPEPPTPTPAPTPTATPAPFGVTFLRSWGSEGSGDGLLNTPIGIDVDGSGNVYVVDTYNHRVQVFSAEGQFLRRWGSDGSGVGQFQNPSGIALGPSGNVYVTDLLINRVQVFSPDGEFLRAWGSEGGGDGRFQGPDGLAVDAAGLVYVADLKNELVQVFGPGGEFLRQWGGRPGESPHDIAVGQDGQVYVTKIDPRVDSPRVMAYSADGQFLVELGFRAIGDGQFHRPHGIAVDALGNVYVTDLRTNRVLVYNSSGEFLANWGSEGSADGQFDQPQGIAVDMAGNVYVTDSGNHRVQVFAIEWRSP